MYHRAWLIDSTMDQKKIDSFADRIFNEVNSAMSTLNLYLGYRLNLYQKINDLGAVTSSELARKTSFSERYLREWLECMATNGYLDHDPATGQFSISPEHAIVLIDRDNKAFAIPFVCYIPSFASVLTDLVKAFGNGGGISYEKYGPDLLEAIGVGNRPMFVNDYVAKWIPAMPDIENKLRAGGRVAEVGCGIGWSSIILARAFPKSRIDAIDVDPASIEEARRNARQSGIAERVTFYLASVEESSLKGPYDLVTAFECIHDMAYPVRALRRMNEIVDSNGAVLVADELVGETLDENRSLLGRLMYNFSVLHCLPQAMVFPDSAATGTVMSPSKLRTYATEAGFRKVEILPIENPLWRFYRLAP